MICTRHEGRDGLIRTRVLCLVAGALFLIGSAPASAANATYTIEPVLTAAQGHALRSVSEGRAEATITVRAVDGQVLSQKTSKVMNSEEDVDTTVAKDGNHVVVLRHVVRETEEDDKGVVMGELNGVALRFDMRGDAVNVRADGGAALPAAMLDRLRGLAQASMRVERSNLCVMRGQLAIGTSWPVTGEALADCFPSAAHVVRSSAGTAKFSGTREHEGHLYAVVDFQFTREVDALGPLAFDRPVVATTTAHLAVAFDDPQRWRQVSTTTFATTAHPRGPSQPSLELSQRIVETVTSASSP
jgi:predicted RecA/RadA family phage recombinase